jgi:hypothetical protein
MDVNILNKKIVAFRRLTEQELFANGWEADGNCSAIELDDGTILFPSKDEEGNGPGAWFGETKSGDQFGIMANE